MATLGTNDVLVFVMVAVIVVIVGKPPAPKLDVPPPLPPGVPGLDRGLVIGMLEKIAIRPPPPPAPAFPDTAP
jgi:hypothetical protein